MRLSLPFLASVLALAVFLADHRTAAASLPEAPNGGLTALVLPERGLIEWHFKGRKLLAYTFATNQFKPYVRELYSLRGDAFLREAPSDHLHHHGLISAPNFRMAAMPLVMEAWRNIVVLEKTSTFKGVGTAGVCSGIELVVRQRARQGRTRHSFMMSPVRLTTCVIR